MDEFVADNFTNLGVVGGALGLLVALVVWLRHETHQEKNGDC